MIKEKDGKLHYYDRNGAEIHEGDSIRWPDGKVEKVYLTVEGELGTDATNPLWVQTGRAVACEYGIYPLTEADTHEVELAGGQE